LSCLTRFLEHLSIAYDPARRGFT